MELLHGLADCLEALGFFGGIGLVILASNKAKIDRMKARAAAWQQAAAPEASSTVLAELKALRQQMEQMHSTSHQFDISFDEALNRLEGRVGRLETKSAAGTATTTETPATLRNGQSQ